MMRRRARGCLVASLANAERAACELMMSGQILPDLQAKGLYLYWVDLDRFESSRFESSRFADEELSVEERDRAARFVTDTLRRRYTAAHLFLRQTLARFCGARPEQLRFSENAWGKPSVSSHPALHFNLSHSQHLALVGISTVNAIGVDIELLQRWPDKELCSLSQTIMTSAEQQSLQTTLQSSTDQNEASHAFLNAWTRKEACVKALGLGLSYDVRQLEVGLMPTSMAITAPANGGSLLADCKLWLQSTRGPEGAPISVAELQS